MALICEIDGTTLDALKSPINKAEIVVGFAGPMGALFCHKVL